MHRPRVLVVDDSVVVRRLVSKALEAEGEVEVVGVAADGAIALVNIERLHPDVVILDVAMPVMDGLAALAEIRQRWPGLPVIMFSTLTSRGAEVTLDALALGASDYVLKPSSSDPESAMAEIRTQLLPRIAALLPQAREARERSARTGGRAARPSGTVTRPAGPPERIDVIAIGVSTGGPTALARADPVAAGRSAGADRDRPAHAADVHARSWPSGSTTRARCRWPRPPTATVCGRATSRSRPATATCRWSSGTATICTSTTEPHENSCRPSVDPLFRSVAAAYGPHALGIVMTGMGSDGLRGAEHLAAAGAHLIVQDEATSVVWGMPGFVARAGLVRRGAAARGRCAARSAPGRGRTRPRARGGGVVSAPGPRRRAGPARRRLRVPPRADAPARGDRARAGEGVPGVVASGARRARPRT